MKTIAFNDAAPALRQAAVNYAKAWIINNIKDPSPSSGYSLNQVEISLIYQFDFPIRHIEVHLPPSIDPEAAKYPDADLPDGFFRVAVFAADSDDNVELLAPLEALS